MQELAHRGDVGRRRAVLREMSHALANGRMGAGQAGAGTHRCPEINPCAAHSASMASTVSARSSTSHRWSAPVAPIETWSSWLALVGMLSTDAGWASVWSSFTSDAAVYCTIISPLRRPGSSERKGGKPERCASTRRAVRRSEIDASSVRAILP